MYCGKRHTSGFTIHAVADLNGRLVDAALTRPGARRDSKAPHESGIDAAGRRTDNRTGRARSMIRATWVPPR